MCNDMHATGAQRFCYLVASNPFYALRWLEQGDTTDKKALGLRTNGRT